MPLLLLIRHATTAATGHRLIGWTPGIPLDDAGRAQADALGQRLQSVKLVALYSSPLERCMQTAAALTAGRSLEIVEEPRVGEVRYGSWTGRSLSSLARTALWKKVQTTPSRVRFPGAGGESFVEVLQRSVAAVEAAADRHQKGTVAVVSHGDVIKLLVSHFAGAPLDLFQRIVVAPASVTALYLGDGIPRLLRLNDVGSLADLAGPSRSPKAARPSGVRR